jgi:hypothetical protein
LVGTRTVVSTKVAHQFSLCWVESGDSTEHDTRALTHPSLASVHDIRDVLALLTTCWLACSIVNTLVNCSVVDIVKIMAPPNAGLRQTLGDIYE